jgi:hypothetical protein
MPRYYSPTIKDYEIKVSPKGRWRLPLYKFGIKLPYFVGDKVRLEIKLRKIEAGGEELSDVLSIWSKYPHYGDNEPKQEMAISLEGLVKGFKLVSKSEYEPLVEISEPGRVVIYIAEERERIPYNIFTADVYNDDSFNFFVVWPIIGIMIMFCGLIVSIIALIISLSGGG